MKRTLLSLALVALMLLWFPLQSWAVCPEDTVDSGECDTLYVEICPGDEQFMPPGPELVRFPIYVTHDLPDPVDSLAVFTIPLCYTSSNPSANAILPDTCNTTGLFPWPNLHRSIFRHLDCGGDVITNWMMALSERLDDSQWDTIILDLVGEGEQTQVFWLCMFPTGSADQRFWEGSRVLLATMTFRLEDTTTICIDSCFWPPNSRLGFTRSDAASYVPRHRMPICGLISYYGMPPYFLVCPGNQVHGTNGTGFSSSFVVTDADGIVVHVEAGFSGSGVTNVHLVYTVPPPAAVVEGYVEYEVSDHCQPGGSITLTGWDDQGQPWDCDFEVTLVNDPPYFSLPSSWTALAGYTMILKVPAAADQNGDSVSAVELDAFWFEPDSLQAPTNPRTYNPGDPGFFTWVPEEADTGTWISSFSATDACGALASRQAAILVGMPFCGDCTGEGRVDVSDVVYLIGYLFKAGPAPDPLCKGDVTCDGTVEAGDLVYLINYFFRFGPAPCFECCP